MAFTKTFVASLVITLLVANLIDEGLGLESHSDSLVVVKAERSLLPLMDCGRACTARCRLSRRPRLCKRACGTCCARCNCVPSGTAGNVEECPCYASMTTRRNRRKCP